MQRSACNIPIPQATRSPFQNGGNHEAHTPLWEETDRMEKGNMTIRERYQPQIERFVGVCHRLAERGDVTSHGGNLAWRMGEDVILITATCLAKRDHQPEDVVLINSQGKPLEDGKRPTGELPIYLALFNRRPDVQSIVHCHPPACCALAVRDGENPLVLPLFPEVTLEIGPVPLVPYATPLTDELANNFGPYLKGHNAFLMENHGVLAVTPRDLD
ncbi:MAG: class II aldolase/adducin family protein [Betaproteobacteria bacterium]|nr:class II aldolase/adducin family protein [Betaproteobacteria bacterium]